MIRKLVKYLLLRPEVPGPNSTPLAGWLGYFPSIGSANFFAASTDAQVGRDRGIGRAEVNCEFNHCTILLSVNLLLLGGLTESLKPNQFHKCCEGRLSMGLVMVVYGHFQTQVG